MPEVCVNKINVHLKYKEIKVQIVKSERGFQYPCMALQGAIIYRSAQLAANGLELFAFQQSNY